MTSVRMTMNMVFTVLPAIPIMPLRNDDTLVRNSTLIAGKPEEHTAIIIAPSSVLDHRFAPYLRQHIPSFSCA